MGLAWVEALSPPAVARAESLARLLNVPVGPVAQEGTAGVKIVVSEVALGLGFVDSKRGKPHYVDFLTREWKTRFATGLAKRHIFARALGLKGQAVHVIDATAGFGQDALLAVAMGCQVTALESSKVVVQLLRDGLLRANSEDESLKIKLSHIQVVETEAKEFLATQPIADVVYLDPMFEKPKKTAKSPKEMQLLQELLGEPPSANEVEEIFQLALSTARSRVVIKRPLKSQALWRTPSHSFKGQSIRYDVYVSN